VKKNTNYISNDFDIKWRLQMFLISKETDRHFKRLALACVFVAFFATCHRQYFPYRCE